MVAEHPILGLPARREGPDSGVQQHGPLVDKIYFQDTLLTTAQMLALRATNIEAVKAPPAGWAAVPIAVHIFLNFGGTDFIQTANADQLALLYNGGAEIAEIGLEATFALFLEASADEAFYVNLGEGGTAGAGGVTPEGATAIDFDNNGANEWVTGDGDMSIRVYYRLVPVVSF